MTCEERLSIGAGVLGLGPWLAGVIAIAARASGVVVVACVSMLPIGLAAMLLALRAQRHAIHPRRTAYRLVANLGVGFGFFAALTGGFLLIVGVGVVPRLMVDW